MCKGASKNGRHQSCGFFHDGHWGDEELVKHQKMHQSLASPDYFWLGFDLSQESGVYSGRDGKR
ncbi:MAG: hypothetical protein OXC46_12270 [Thaumarchaeota archaeon]|nr:hypothetical protein [Nitrososphaerota archaeon]